ncbi:MAG TPA: glycosyltransferase family 9 protein [Fimbriimonadaceae bacterium]|nr:glycosyltransferase family 9 protein [Fimbriimonadaceae bacterium]
MRFAAIGDCVMAAWAATAYRDKYPDGKLVWAVDPRCSAVVETDRLVTSLAEFPRDKWKSGRWSPSTWREQLQTYAGLRRHRFDWGVDLQGHSKTALALRIAKPMRRIAVGATDLLARRMNPQLAPSPDGTHTVERNHTALGTFDEFELPERPMMPAVTGGRDAKLVTISTGAGSKQKMWLPERWSEVAAGLIAEGFRVTMLGGPDDPRVEAPGVEDLVAKIPLVETMGWVARSALHLSADTGTGHMAAAYGVPVVSVFGPSDDRRFRPFTKEGVVLKSGATTAEIGAEEVLAAAERLLSGAAKGSACAS